MSDHAQWFAPNSEAQNVPGFLTAASAEMISRLLTLQIDIDEKGSLAEIGTYMGKTFVGLAKASRVNERVVGYDLFTDNVRDGFLAALQHLSVEQKARVHAIQADTGNITAVAWINNLAQPARFIHIDGEHKGKGVLRDMNLAATHLSPRALVVIDDFLHDWYPDVTEAVIAGLRAIPKISPVAIIPRSGSVRDGGSKLICSTSESADSYKDFLVKEFSDRGPQRRRLAGESAVVFQRY